MRTLTTLAAAVAVAATAGAVVAPTLATASTPPAVSSPAARQAATLGLRFHPRGGGQVDIDPAGMSLGDEFFEHGRISGAARGSFSLSGELIRMPGSSTPPWESQHFTLRLRGGTIEATGQHAALDTFTVAVTGGTGTWRHASGTMRVDHGRVTLRVRH